MSGDEFATMIAISTANQKRLGLPAPFQTGEERDACFKVVMIVLMMFVMMFMAMIIMIIMVVITPDSRLSIESMNMF